MTYNFIIVFIKKNSQNERFMIKYMIHLNHLKNIVDNLYIRTNNLDELQKYSNLELMLVIL